jgi:signal transduction histidine kinase
MRTIGARSLDRRLPPARTAELQPVVDTLNDLLTRLASAFERERRFTSAAAHELKNPIAELRTLAELAVRWPDDPEVAAATCAELVALAKQMERTVSTLLELARAESGLPRATEVRPTDVSGLVARAWERVATRAAERGLRFSAAVSAERVMHTDPILLDRIVSNLLDNAVEYAAPGGTIRVVANGAASALHLLVANTATGGVDGAALAHFFEPFWRAAPLHDGDRGHVGLGLPLVRAICEALGGRVAARLEDREVKLEVELPDARPR